MACNGHGILQLAHCIDVQAARKMHLRARVASCRDPHHSEITSGTSSRRSQGTSPPKRPLPAQNSWRHGLALPDSFPTAKQASCTPHLPPPTPTSLSPLGSPAPCFRIRRGYSCHCAGAPRHSCLGGVRAVAASAPADVCSCPSRRRQSACRSVWRLPPRLVLRSACRPRDAFRQTLACLPAFAVAGASSVSPVSGETRAGSGSRGPPAPWASEIPERAGGRDGPRLQPRRDRPGSRTCLACCSCRGPEPGQAVTAPVL